MGSIAPQTSSLPASPASQAAARDVQDAGGGPSRRPVSWRSLSLGLAGVLFICALTPYNDYVVNNTNLIGSHLPIGLLLFFLVVILLINAPLWKWAPRRALRSGELAVALGMMLVSCALPSVGLMRQLPGHLAAVFYHSSNNAEYAELVRKLDLPDWMFPAFERTAPAKRGAEPVVQQFVGRVPVEQETLGTRWRAVPWRAWRTPALTWGLFVGLLAGAALCGAMVLRRQWAESERLPFPLASVYLALIEEPAKGSAFNALFVSRGFWVAFAAVFALGAINALHVYDAKAWPQIPTRFNLTALFSEPPWRDMEPDFKAAGIYFSIVGIVFFLQSKVAFSLWFFFAAVQAARMVMGKYQDQLTPGMETDETFGAIIPFAAAVLWVGRGHLWLVLRQMVRGAREGEARGRYLPYAAAGWGLAACLAGLGAWLWAAGMSPAGAVVTVGMLLLLYLVATRIVAATGLLYVLVPVPLLQPWVMALQTLGTRTTLGSYFFSSYLGSILTRDLRESLPAYALHALRVADGAAYERERNWKRAAPFIGSLALALGVGYVTSGASMLYCEYAHAHTLDRQQLSPINEGGALGTARKWGLDTTLQFVPPREGPREGHNRLKHFGLGAALSALLSALRLRYENWPLHPVGFILCYTWGIRMIWFSVFLGWLAKVLVVRFGGARLFRASIPVALGLILGEASAAAFWLVVSLVRLWMGMDYYSIRLLPL